MLVRIRFFFPSLHLQVNFEIAGKQRSCTPCKQSHTPMDHCLDSLALGFHSVAEFLCSEEELLGVIMSVGLSVGHWKILTNF